MFDDKPSVLINVHGLTTLVIDHEGAFLGWVTPTLDGRFLAIVYRDRSGVCLGSFALESAAVAAIEEAEDTTVTSNKKAGHSDG